MAAPAPTKKKKADLKVVILGTANIGKTCLIQRYINGQFQDSKSTIGASFALKQWGEFNVAIWDTAGEERFAGLSSFYCRGAGAAIVAYDVTDEDTFHAIRARFAKLLNGAEENCLCVVVATKMDLLDKRKRAVSTEDGMCLSRELNRQRNNEVPFFETSSLTGQNVNRVFEYIFTSSLNGSQPKSVKRKSSVVDLTQGNIPVGQSKGGCC